MALMKKQDGTFRIYAATGSKRTGTAKTTAGAITKATESDAAATRTAEKKPELANWQKVMDNGEYLRSAEMAEEANYNMIDGLMNNTPKKKDKNAPRRSVLKRLRKHQQKIASQRKGQPQQQRAVEEEMERKKK